MTAEQPQSPWVLLLPRTIGSLILGFILVVFVTVTLAWILFGVMDEY